MAKRYFLVQCVSKKRSRPRPARDLYCSDWFLKARAYVEAQNQPWFILSGKHGLVRPERVISPYNRTLPAMTREGRRVWAERVQAQLRRHLRPGDQVVFLAGEVYRDHLVPAVRAMGCSVRIPM